MSHTAQLDAYAIVTDVDSLPRVSAYLQKMRELGVTVQMHATTPEGMGSMKSQFKRADASGARYALVFGADELALGKVAVKPLRATESTQVLHPLNEIEVWAKSLQLNA